jgi:hypothetical protein
MLRGFRLNKAARDGKTDNAMKDLHQDFIRIGLLPSGWIPLTLERLTCRLFVLSNFEFHFFIRIVSDEPAQLKNIH